MVISIPVSPALALRSRSSWVRVGAVKVSIAERASSSHVLPIEKLLLLFSLALCNLTRPDRRTDTIITLGFLFDSADSNGGGAEGEVASSHTGIWVMYDSASSKGRSVSKAILDRGQKSCARF